MGLCRQSALAQAEKRVPEGYRRRVFSTILLLNFEKALWKYIIGTLAQSHPILQLRVENLFVCSKTQPCTMKDLIELLTPTCYFKEETLKNAYLFQERKRTIFAYFVLFRISNNDLTQV